MTIKNIQSFILACALCLQQAHAEPKKEYPLTFGVCEENALIQRAVIQYLPTLGLLAWREYRNADAAICVRQDLPLARSLTRVQAQALYEALQSQHRTMAIRLQPLQAITVSDAGGAKKWRLHDLPPNARLGPSTRSEPGCAPRKAAANQQYWRFADHDPSFAARLGPTVCDNDAKFGGAGTAAMISPHWALSAGHVMTDEQGVVHCKFRLSPGGAAYSANPAQPFGVWHSERIVLSPAAHEILSQPAHEQSVQSLPEYVANDYALLRLITPKDRSVNPVNDAQRIWPAYEFTPEPAPHFAQVYKSGYPREAPAQMLRAAGASLSADGSSACATSADVAAFSLLTFHGDSGAPIWVHPDQHPRAWLSVISIVSVVESNHEDAAFTFGPRFTLKLYDNLMQQLRE
jgi:V8-like Glu-specific endopeptidase